jgi:hypothetical protein
MIDFFSYEKDQYGLGRRHDPLLRLVPGDWQQVPSDGCSCNSCLSRLYRDKISLPVRDYCYSVGIKRDEPKRDHFYFLCDYVLRGYALNERRWGKIPFMMSTIDSLIIFNADALHIDQVSDPRIEPHPL